MPNDFFTVCKLKKEFLPEKECTEGSLGVSSRNTKGCLWYIDSISDHNCFWRWTQRRSDAEGDMPIIPNKEIPKLLNLPTTKATLLLAEALENFKKTDAFQELKDSTSSSE